MIARRQEQNGVYFRLAHLLEPYFSKPILISSDWSAVSG